MAKLWRAAIPSDADRIGPQDGPQTAFLMSPADIVIYGGAAGGGKLLPLDTPIPTPDGWKLNGELVAGDLVFSENGAPCRVVVAHDPQMPAKAYRLTFDDGETIEAGAEHLWLTFTASDLGKLSRRTPEFRKRRREKRPSEAATNKSERFRASISRLNSERQYQYAEPPTGAVRSTEEIANSLRTRSGRANHAIPIAKPLTLPDVHLPIDPYIFGLWLGDGTTRSGELTCADEETVERMRSLGREIRKIPSTKYGYRIVDLTKELRACSLLGKKHIPALYLRASFGQRLALLQGLIDTDGSCDGSVELSLSDKVLADDAAELIRSLGHKVALRPGPTKCKTRYRMTFRSELPLFRLSRKAARQTTPSRRTVKFRYIVACESVAPRPMRCITVDNPTGLYLAGRGMIVTHNTHGLLLEPLRNVLVPGFSGTIFRRTMPQITNPGGLWDASLKLFPRLGARPLAPPRAEWHWPNGGKVKFAHLQREDTVYNWQGSEIPFIGFDELSHFSASQFWYMVSRNRSTCGVRPYIRATTNPDADSWVANLIAWWIDQESGFAIPERAGVIRYLARVNDKLVWADDPGELRQYLPSLKDLPAGTPLPEPKSVTFIPAQLSDNQALLRANPEYLVNLHALPTVERERLLGGNWKIRPAAGLYFQRNWCEFIETRPAGLELVRYWDLAGTAKTETNDPDWTVGVLMGKDAAGFYYLLDVIRERVDPHGVEQLMKNAASSDGKSVRVRFGLDPGQAGKSQAAAIVRLTLPGYDVRGVPESGEKTTRFGPFSAQCRAGNVKILRGHWNDEFCRLLEGFPGLAHDDEADACSSAFTALLGVMKGEGIFGFTKQLAAEIAASQKKPERPKVEPARGSQEWIDCYGR